MNMYTSAMHEPTNALARNFFRSSSFFFNSSSIVLLYFHK